MNTIIKWMLLATLLVVISTTRAQTAKSWRDSLMVLNEQIRKYPNSTDLRLRKAAVNIELEQWEYAIDEYSRVLELDSKNPAALYYRAYANSNIRRYDLAKYDYERFLSIVPKHFEAQLGLAMIKRKLGKKSETLEELNKLIQLFPDSALAFAVRADYERELQQYEPALYDWDEALRLQPENVEYMVSKVDLLISLKRHEEAWDILDAAMKRGVPKAALKEWIDKCK